MASKDELSATTVTAAATESSTTPGTPPDPDHSEENKERGGSEGSGEDEETSEDDDDDDEWETDYEDDDDDDDDCDDGGDEESGSGAMTSETTATQRSSTTQEKRRKRRRQQQQQQIDPDLSEESDVLVSSDDESWALRFQRGHNYRDDNDSNSDDEYEDWVLEKLHTTGSDLEESSDEEERFRRLAGCDDNDDDDDDDGVEEEGEGDKEGEAVQGGASSRKKKEKIPRMSPDEWVQDFKDFPFTCPPFSGGGGGGGLGLHTASTCRTPVDFFNELITEDLLQMIVRETNRYAQDHWTELQDAGLSQEWPQGGLTVRDLLAFLAIVASMGLMHKPDLASYWSVHPILFTPMCHLHMSRRKFFAILAALHISDNATYVPRGHDDHDPCHKIRPLYAHLLEKFRSMYTPGENVSINERIAARFSKSRPGTLIMDKHGMKMYQLCESGSRYVHNFEVLLGETGLSNDPCAVVKRLAQPLLDQGRTVYVDGRMTCPPLAHALLQRKTHCVGRAKDSKKCKWLLPQFRSKPRPPVDNVLAFRKGGVAVMQWMAYKRHPVHYITTKVDPFSRVEVRMGRQKVAQVPAAIQDWWTNMVEVTDDPEPDSAERAEFFLHSSPLMRQKMKKWKKVFLHLFNLSMIQARCLYNLRQKCQGCPEMALSDFQKVIVDYLDDRVLRPAWSTGEGHNPKWADGTPMLTEKKKARYLQGMKWGLEDLVRLSEKHSLEKTSPEKQTKTSITTTTTSCKEKTTTKTSPGKQSATANANKKKTTTTTTTTRSTTAASGKEENVLHKCRVCWRRRKMKSRVDTRCQDCPSQPYLCADPCFTTYHTVHSYWDYHSDEEEEDEGGQCVVA